MDNEVVCMTVILALICVGFFGVSSCTKAQLALDHEASLARIKAGLVEQEFCSAYSTKWIKAEEGSSQ